MRILGIDVGGTNIRAVISGGQTARAVGVWKTPRTRAKFGKLLVSLAGQCKPDAIGIGAAGVVRGTRVLESTNISYLKDFDFREVFNDAITVRSMSGHRMTSGHSMTTILTTGAPLRVDNDARCFARGEYRSSRGNVVSREGRKARTMFAITLGTGVGRAVVKNGKILRIKRFEEAEPWEPEYQRVRDWGDDVLLAGFLTERLAELIRPYGPDTLVIGGGVAERPEVFRLLRTYFLREKLARHIVRPHFGVNVAAIGAALLWRNSKHKTRNSKLTA